MVNLCAASITIDIIELKLRIIRPGFQHKMLNPRHRWRCNEPPFIVTASSNRIQSRSHTRHSKDWTSIGTSTKSPNPLSSSTVRPMSMFTTCCSLLRRDGNAKTRIGYNILKCCMLLGQLSHVYCSLLLPIRHAAAERAFNCEASSTVCPTRDPSD